MSKDQGGSAATLAVLVGRYRGDNRPAAIAAAKHDREVALVRGLLWSTGGRPIESHAVDACIVFETWRGAVDAAITLIMAAQSTGPLADIEVRVAVDISDSTDDARVATHVSALAGSADSNELRLGDALCDVVRQDLPDGWILRLLEGGEKGSASVAYSLADARFHVPNNLVPALTSFVGREAEVRAVRGLLDVARLVTITGPPGAGKTRLASAIAERLLGHFEDGVWFVELAPISDPILMLPTIADVLGVGYSNDRPLIDVLGAHLRTRKVLIVLDNFEQIPEAGSDLVPVLAAAPGLHVLVTSRLLLHLSVEQEYQLPALGLPALGRDIGDVARSEAVDLFSRRAAASQPSFRLVADNAGEVAELCRRLDGLPLAIELAAARVKLLPLPAIISRLDHRLSLLTGGPRDLPDRQRSLRAAVAWSYDLLDSSAQRVFRSLSVFRGGWTIDAAEAVCRPIELPEEGLFETLASLLDASLLARQPAEATVARFTMLETLREFAGERLDEEGEADTFRERHAGYGLDVLQREAPGFTGSDPAAALDRVAMEHDNLRAAFDFLLERRPTEALRLGAKMWRFWQMRGHLLEGSRALDRALDAAGNDAPPQLRADALSAAGGLAYWRGDMAETQLFYERALALRRSVGDRAGIADGLYDLAFALGPFNRPPPLDIGRTDEAMRLAEEAEVLYGAEDNATGIARSGWLVGTLMLYRDLGRARTLLEASVRRFRDLSDPFGLGWALRTYGLSLLGTADSGAAAEAFGEALRLFAAMQDSSAMGMLLDDFTEVARAEGDLFRAACLKGAAGTMRQVTDAQVANASESPWVNAAAAPELPIDPLLIEHATAEGEAMTEAEAIAYALRSDAMSVRGERLMVTTLGSFLVERAGKPVTRWGGLKAGSRQAQAMFAFLLDRGERGVNKDEFIEVIWPDSVVTQGDLNVHRTLAGLRATLEPDVISKSRSAVRFVNGRYRLDPSIIGKLDANEFEQRLSNAAQATDDLAGIRGLEAARSLYRGDYLDDCPIYGDSEFVEERRRFLRGRYSDALVELGQRYEARGERALAATRFREALQASGGDHPTAAEGLKRLGGVSA